MQHLVIRDSKPQFVFCQNSRNHKMHAVLTLRTTILTELSGQFTGHKIRDIYHIIITVYTVQTSTAVEPHAIDFVNEF